MSYLSHLECSACGRTLDADAVHSVCPACGRVLLARYDLAALRRAADRSVWERRTDASMWRFRELLPVRDPAHVLTLGEGGTPLLELRNVPEARRVRRLLVKDEGLNPTGTFKARGMSAALSRARELGLRRFVAPSAGNAAAALAAYAARGRLDVRVVLPEDTPPAIVAECRAYGVEPELVAGTIADAGTRAAVWVERGYFSLATLREPYRVEGKKTMGLEVALQMGWRLPSVVVYPTGGGTGLIGLWKAFQELRALGWVEPPLPRMVAVQAAGCAPIVRAFAAGRTRVEAPWPNPQTAAFGLCVPAPFADDLILRVLRESGGAALAVTDDEVWDAARTLMRQEGLFPCPEGAATYAGLRRLIESGGVGPDDTVLLIQTGAAWKYGTSRGGGEIGG